MKIELEKKLASFLRKNKENEHKINLERFIQDRISFYSKQEQRPAEQIKGMNVIFGDIIELDERLFNEANNT